jgi:predicted  nucleic acid-binding Zn-ribbon protein
MPELTLKAIEQLLDLKLDEKLDVKLAPIKETLDSHTTALDNIAKDVKNWNVEMTVMRSRMDRYESALKTIGEKLNLDVTPLLHP